MTRSATDNNDPHIKQHNPIPSYLHALFNHLDWKAGTNIVDWCISIKRHSELITNGLVSIPRKVIFPTAYMPFNGSRLGEPHL